MNIKLLKEVIRHIKKNILCPSCNAQFHDKNINIVGALPDQAMFHIKCSQCKEQVVMNTMVQNNRKHRKIKLEKHDSLSSRNETVSKDEVLDMHNFLKNFDGNFIKNFNVKKK